MEELGLMENTSLLGRPELNEEEAAEPGVMFVKYPSWEGCSLCTASRVESQEPGVQGGFVVLWFISLSSF